MKPVVSVVIPTFNRAQMVCDCVASVLAAEGPEREVIVVDDCSPDGTAASLRERFGDDARLGPHGRRGEGTASDSEQVEHAHVWPNG